MRYLAILLGLCFISVFLSSPLTAAVSPRSATLTRVKKNKNKVKKFKPHKAPKHQARKASRVN